MAQVSEPSHPTGSSEERTPFRCRDRPLSWSIGYGEAQTQSHPTGSCAFRASVAKQTTAFYPLKRGGAYPRFFGKVIGIDISPGMIAQAQKKANILGLNNLEFLLADAEDIDFPENHFERIFCASAFIRMSDLVKSLLLWRKFIKPGGILGIQAFAETAFVGGVITQNILKKYGISYLMSQPTGTVEKCQNLLQKASFELIEIKVEQDGNYISLESAKKCGLENLILHQDNTLTLYHSFQQSN